MMLSNVIRLGIVFGRDLLKPSGTFGLQLLDLGVSIVQGVGHRFDPARNHVCVGAADHDLAFATKDLGDVPHPIRIQARPLLIGHHRFTPLTFSHD